MPQILVSEITRMRPGMNCIAGFLLDEQHMARPLNPQGELHWSDETLAEIGWQVRGLYEVTPTGACSTRRLPHHRDDYFVDPSSVHLRKRLDTAATRRLLRPTVSATLDAIFDGELVNNQYVEEGSDCRSLGAIEIPTRLFGFNFSFDKLRCWMRVGEQRPEITVTAVEFGEIGSEEEAEALQRRIRRYRRAHLRIGLANAWRGPDGEYSPRRCFVMVNGIFPFD